MHATAEICRIRAEQKGIAFVFKPGPTLPAGVRVDQRRLRQILLNLLGNAIKFTENGSVTFTVVEVPGGPQARARISPEGGASPESRTQMHRIRFEIEDTGTGISAEHLGEIFLPFKQVGDKSRHREGTGLGLAISQRIVTLMGSSIQVRSELGKGSVFWVDLTLAEAPNWTDTVRRTEQGQIVGYKGPRRRLLVVDDKPENRAVVISMLATLGFELAEANDGQEGLDRTASERFDLIITDLAMPVLDGWEMMRRMRKVPELEGRSSSRPPPARSSPTRTRAWTPARTISWPSRCRWMSCSRSCSGTSSWSGSTSGRTAPARRRSRAPSSSVTSPPMSSCPGRGPQGLASSSRARGSSTTSRNTRTSSSWADPRLAPFARHLRGLSEDFRLESMKSSSAGASTVARR